MNTPLKLPVDEEPFLSDRSDGARRNTHAKSLGLSLGGNKIQPPHLERLAVVYVRQSTPQQVLDHRESRELQYKLADRAVDLGWSRDRVLVIDDDQVEIRPAAAYWGQGALIAEKNLKDDLGEDFQVMTIGPAGEKCVRYACLSHDFGRQAGRSGVGAVLGSKNIKAIAIRGTRGLMLQSTS